MFHNGKPCTSFNEFCNPQRDAGGNTASVFPSLKFLFKKKKNLKERHQRLYDIGRVVEETGQKIRRFFCVWYCAWNSPVREVLNQAIPPAYGQKNFINIVIANFKP